MGVVLIHSFQQLVFQYSKQSFLMISSTKFFRIYSTLPCNCCWAVHRTLQASSSSVSIFWSRSCKVQGTCRKDRRDALWVVEELGIEQQLTKICTNGWSKKDFPNNFFHVYTVLATVRTISVTTYRMHHVIAILLGATAPSKLNIYFNLNTCLFVLRVHNCTRW